MQRIPLQTSGSWVVPTRPVVTNDEGYIVNAVGTQNDWDFRGSAKMPRGDPTLEHYLSVSQVNGIPTYLDAEEGALAWDYAGQNLYVFNGTAWVLVSSGGGLQNLAQTLAIGNVTGVNDIIVSGSQSINYLGGLQIGHTGAAALASVTGIAIGGGSQATANISLAIGLNALATGVGGFAIGNSAAALGFRSFCMGANSSAGAADGNFVIGNVSVIAGDLPGQTNQVIAIGNQNTITGALRSTFIGDTITSVSKTDTIGIGSGVGVGSRCVVVGSLASTTTDENVIIGAAASTALSFCTAVGYSATTGSGVNGGQFSTSVGWGASCEEGSAVAIGADSFSAYRGVAVGYLANAGFDGITIGCQANALNSGTAIGVQSNAGSGGVAIGEGSLHTFPNAVTVGNNSLGGLSSVAIGFQTVAAGSNDISIGAGAFIAETATQCISIGNSIIAGNQSTSCVMGFGNAVGFSAQQLAMIGTGNNIGTGCNFSTVLGNANTLGNGCSQNFVAGNDNVVTEQTVGVVIGKANVANSVYNVVIGYQNQDNGDNSVGKSVVIGAENTASDHNPNRRKVLIGDGNVGRRGGAYIGVTNVFQSTALSDDYAVMMGAVNISTCNHTVMIGEDLSAVTSITGDSVINIGYENSLSSQILLQSLCIGWNNNMTSSTVQAENYVIGNNNQVTSGTTNVVCIGHDITATDDDCWYLTPDLPSYSTITQLGYNPTDGRVSWTIPNPSSRRWKENIEPFNEAERVLDLELVQFNWKKGHCRCIGGCDQEPCCAKDVGLIAEDVAEILPQIVNFHRDGKQSDKSLPKVPQGLDYGRVGALLIPIVRAQRERISVMEKQLTALTQIVATTKSEPVLDLSALIAALDSQKKEIDTLTREVFQLRSKVFS